MSEKTPDPIRETVKLKHPVEIDGVQVSALHLRRPKVRDRLMMEKMGKNTAEQEIALLSLLAGVAPESLHDLDMGDYIAAQKVLADFLS